MLYFDHIICYLNQGNKGADIMYDMSYMKALEWLREDLSP